MSLLREDKLFKEKIMKKILIEIRFLLIAFSLLLLLLKSI